MTAEPGLEQRGSSATPSAADVALRLHRARVARQRRWYVGAIAAVAVLVLVGVTIAWYSGTAHHAKLVSATTPDPPVADEPFAASLSVAWTSDDRTATGSYASHGTVVTYSTHAVEGRDARTGDVRWSYTRSDATVCAVDVQDGIATAIFKLDGDCDEAIGIDVGNGDRRWDRTLMDDGSITGIASLPSSVAFSTSTSVHVISPGYDSSNIPSGGLNRWFYVPANCTITGFALGNQGVLIGRLCSSDDTSSDAPTAAGPKDKPSVVLRKPYDDDDIWTAESDGAAPLLADTGGIIGWDPSAARLVAYDSTAGKRVATLALPGCTGSVAPKAATVSSTELVYCSGTLSAVSFANDALSIAWSLPAVGLPAAQLTTESSAGTAVVPTAAGLQRITVRTGAPVGGLTPVPAGAESAVSTAASLERFGSGVLVSGQRTVMLAGPS
jgi:hypothetical protein